MLRKCLFCYYFIFHIAIAASQPVIYSVEYGHRPFQPPGLTPVFHSSYLGFENVYVVIDNWYYASRQRADSVGADAFLIPGGNTSDVPFYDGSLDSYVSLLQNPGRPAMGFCAGIQFLLMARGGICAPRSGERGDQIATIYAWDEIFEGSPNPYTDRAAHSYSIADMPDCYQNYAVTRTCYVTFVRHITMPLYGTQLHIERMSNANSAGPAVLGNFRNIIMARPFHGVAEVIGFPGEPGRVRVTWWPAKTDEAVTYQVYYNQDDVNLDYSALQVETRDVHCELDGLDADATYYFAVRARSDAFADTNTAVFPFKPDGRREITFQNGKAIDGQMYDACEATVIHQAYPNSNYGRRGSPGKDKLYWWNSGLVQFKELEEQLAGKTIIGGKVTFLFVGGVTDFTTASHVAEMKIYQVLKPWNEGIGYTNGEARPGEVTWNSAQHGTKLWETAGCRGSSDRASEPVAAYTLKGDGTGISFDGTVPLPAGLIQTWVDHPDDNHGLLYEKVDSYPTDEYFYFEDNDDEWFMNRPRLIVYYLDESGTPVADADAEAMPLSHGLGQNYPNPFNQATTIPVEIHRPVDVKLDVVDIRGRTVAVIHTGRLNAGTHRFSWDGRDATGRRVTSGLYFSRLQMGDERHIGRMLLVR
ncbi:DNRLRE domain-containing protein [candidate division KSB1 bacterium]|nr:DNRLRE domain-containing protein [candidate division KSB1 bacterium]